MPATTKHGSSSTPAWLALREACQRQGRKLWWVAQQAGMSYRTLHAKMNQQDGYIWRPGERERIAAALSLTLADLWPDAAPTTATVEDGAEREQR